MNHLLSCYTLFDITQTNVLNRSKPSASDIPKVWSYRRNTQANFDTILQAISLRSQPEVVRIPTKIKTELDDKFGFLYKGYEEVVCWTFDFYVQHPSVFDDGIEKLGYLYSDCDGVPMIKCNTEWHKVSNFLDTTPELRNIYFLYHEQN
jgi:hypothetical protein